MLNSARPNLAKNKPVMYSSRFNMKFAARVTDDDLSQVAASCAQTSTEDENWFMVDLEKEYQVESVTVFAADTDGKKHILIAERCPTFPSSNALNRNAV